MSLFQQDDINKAITFLQQCILKNLKSNGLTMIPIFFNNKHYDFMKSSSKSTRFGAKYYMDMKTKGVLRVVNMPQFRSIIVHYKHKKLGFKTKCLKEIKYFKHIKTSRESEKENNYYNPQSNSSLTETNTYETELLVNEDTDDNYSDTSDLSSGLSINHDGGYKCCKCDLVFMQKQQLGIHLKVISISLSDNRKIVHIFITQYVTEPCNSIVFTYYKMMLIIVKCNNTFIS